MGDELTPAERVAIDIDTRLTPVWEGVWDMVPEELQRLFGTCIRAAYGLGYSDGIKECDEGRRGELARVNGYTKEEH